MSYHSCQARVCETHCKKSKDYLSEPSYYPVYKTFKIEDQREYAEYLGNQDWKETRGDTTMDSANSDTTNLKDLNLDGEVIKGGLNIPTSSTIT